ncbi:hypothetical protein NBO_11g0019 [Nosema bombycis CQ1]|uniref:Uncharacterized protein n=1 Tax=Nosema bombycis (strain CQ1 / CVCC 102059) TaxID=578461 RepID=R0KVP0_NOSB1|nr:hypothetical protein NBO_11g0019 [Nosema bombycis CQ1]|eukprot:EOB14946.1 hypothetical protein NBO_11g0019 [Nosema bombycis CQ1]
MKRGEGGDLNKKKVKQRVLDKKGDHQEKVEYLCMVSLGSFIGPPYIPYLYLFILRPPFPTSPPYLTSYMPPIPLSHTSPFHFMNNSFYLNSNLDYFLDVDIPKTNEELIQTLINCGLEDCDTQKLTKVFEKMKYTEKEIEDYGLKRVWNKIKMSNEGDKEEGSNKREIGDINTEDNIKRFKYKDINSKWEFDIEKICENYTQIKMYLNEFFEDKEIKKIL